jgi:hypothetical protein
MRINSEEIARTLRELKQTPEQRILRQLELLELDEFEVESLAFHWQTLCSLGVNFASHRVQETINAHSYNLEGAILYVIDVNSRLGLHDEHHATNLFVKALREGLKPKKLR